MCFTNQLEQGILKSGEDVSISLWMAKGAKFGAKCLIFCGKDGLVSSELAGEKAEEELILALVGVKIFFMTLPN